MADVKWIKITTDMFEDEKIDYIESLPDSDSVLLIWAKLLCLAGKCNASGYIYLTENMPYTEDMLAHKFKKSSTTIKYALGIFERLNMVEIDEKGIFISNFEKHQSISKLDSIRAYERERKRISREKAKQKLALKEPVKNSENVPDMSRNVRMIEEDIDKDIDKDIDNINYKLILESWNQLPSPIKNIRAITSTRKKKITAKINQGLTIDEIIGAIQKINESNFCKGENNQNWVIDFDWIFKNDSNITKLLEGKYDNRQSYKSQNNGSFNNFEQREYDYDDLEQKLLEASGAR